MLQFSLLTWWGSFHLHLERETSGWSQNNTAEIYSSGKGAGCGICHCEHNRNSRPTGVTPVSRVPSLYFLIPSGGDPHSACSPGAMGELLFTPHTLSHRYNSIIIPFSKRHPDHNQRALSNHHIMLLETNLSTKKKKRSFSQRQEWTILTCPFLPLHHFFLLGHFQNRKLNICFKSPVAAS